MINTVEIAERPAKNWHEFFNQACSPEMKFLKRLPNFPDSVLVAGCQRSGTTMLARLITESDGMTNYWFGSDDEFDAALILSGQVEHVPAGRYCFQTTYINERYREYLVHAAQNRILWITRNPLSVVYSMLYNWSPWAVDLVFESCGVNVVSGTDRLVYKFLGRRRLSLLRRACWAYNGRVSQVFDLHQRLPSERLMIIDYDDLVTHKSTILPLVYEFIDVGYKTQYAEKISGDSLTKKRMLSAKERRIVESVCYPLYGRAKRLCSVKCEVG